MPPPSRDLLQQGHYARKQLFSRNRAIAWSHQRRFALARRLALAHSGGALLDYGCGDGTFIALAHEAFRQSVGTDLDAEQIRGCTGRLGSLPGVEFVPVDALRQPAHAGHYDVIVCMEVLEHCPHDVQPVVVEDLARLLRPDGVVYISVPIEIGPTLLLKQIVRAVAAAGGLTEYAHRERYRAAELFRMTLAGSTSEIERPLTTAAAADGTIVRYHGHKGFNWHLLERIVDRYLRIERRLYSPMPLAGAWLNSQVWFECRKR